MGEKEENLLNSEGKYWFDRGKGSEQRKGGAPMDKGGPPVRIE